VVGSGAAGGMAAYALTQRGVRVVLLEAGRHYDAVREAPMFNLPSQAPLHGAATPDKEQGYYNATVNGGWEIPGEPYSVAEGSEFRWWRARMLGGRTNHWGRMALRFGPYDFKGKSRDGLGADWPISYADLAPWYDRVESLIGVFGSAEGFENAPDSPPGILHDPPRMRAYETWMKLVMGRQHGIPVVPAHMAILTRPHGDRPPCLYATDCQRGCSIRANFQSPTVLLPPALATGRLSIRTHAMVHEVTLDSKGRANGVRYIDTLTGACHSLSARSVVLGASTCESARILLNSTSSAFPNGLANTSGMVGRNLLDTPTVSVAAQVSQLEGLPPFNDEGVSLYHVYSPWWEQARQARGELPFARGYHLEFWGGRRLPEFEDMTDIAELSGSYGAALHNDMRRLYGSVVYLSARGEMLPNPGSRCELDPTRRDRWGIPVLRFHWHWGQEELAQMQHGRQVLLEVFRSMGARLLSEPDPSVAKEIHPGGATVHEAGACRMGADRREAVLDSFNRAWDVPNLLVTDAGAFASNPHKNPTLTILALAWRAADQLADSLGRGDA
jgi:choline dehydrogenase-like flavoprotein